MIHTIILIVMTIIYWAESFQMHELMHIKSHGVKATGTIDVNEIGMTCTSNNPTNPYSSYAGGIYSGIIYLLVALMAYYYGAWGFYLPASTFGVMNLVYGFYEGKYGARGRFKIYITQ